MREIIRDGWDIIACWKPISEKPQMGKAERVAEPEIWREKAKQQSADGAPGKRRSCREETKAQKTSEAASKRAARKSGIRNFWQPSSGGIRMLYGLYVNVSAAERGITTAKRLVVGRPGNGCALFAARPFI